ncbi:MAG: ATP-binding protein [Candidatus Firestonebacteria bacterium]|nr:ATP-binding protein [Candidatus Firestonebacteria bacterium]
MREIFNRWIENSLIGDISHNKVKLIFGARQTGKSTLLKKISTPDAIIINLQDRTERLLYEKNPEELIKRLRAVKDSKMVLIDEIQKVPELLEDIQLIYDENPDKFNFILSGSSARKLHTLSANLLPGRAHQYKLFPVMLSETNNSKESNILPLPEIKKTIKKFPGLEIEDIMLHGCLPGMITEDKNSKTKTLETYAELYLEEEIRKESLIKNIGHFSSFLELSALESGDIMNLTGLSKQSGIPVSTLKTYYQVLVDTFIGYWIPPFITQSRKRILKTPKFYFFDTGVRNALARIPFDPQILKLQAGKLFEQWIVTELYTRCTYLGNGYKLLFWKTVSGTEVDIIISTPQEVIPVEIKWTTSPDKSDIRPIEIFIDEYSKISHRGFIICRTPYKLKLTEKITAIPWHEL